MSPLECCRRDLGERFTLLSYAIVRSETVIQGLTFGIYGATFLPDPVLRTKPVYGPNTEVCVLSSSGNGNYHYPRLVTPFGHVQLLLGCLLFFCD